MTDERQVPEDVEGHYRKPALVEEEEGARDVEGHFQKGRLRADGMPDDEDVEGHHIRGN